MNDWTRHLLEEWQRGIGKPPPEWWTGAASEYPAFAAHTFVTDVVRQDDPPELSAGTVGLVALALTVRGYAHPTWSRWAAEAIARELADRDIKPDNAP